MLRPSTPATVQPTTRMAAAERKLTRKAWTTGCASQATVRLSHMAHLPEFENQNHTPGGRWPAAVEVLRAPALLRSAAADDAHQNNDDRDHEEDVDEPSNGIGRHQAQEPENDENNR